MSVFHPPQSHSQIMSFSINARAPIIRQGIDSYQERLETAGETYTATVNIGFDTAGFTLRGDVAYLRAWFASGLMRDVTWRGPNGRLVWQGYVSALTLYEGNESRVRSIGDMANKISLTHPILDTSTNPPTTGEQATVAANNTTSQAQYGIKALSLSGEAMTTTAATAEAQTAVNRRSVIGIKRQFASGSSDALSLVVSLRGYAHLMNWYQYSQTGSSGTTNSSDVVAAVVAADPNLVLSAATTLIDDNTLQAERYFDGTRTGLAVVQMLTERGDASGNRWVCGVYEGRRLTYKQAEYADGRGNLGASNKRLAVYRNPHDPAADYVDGSGRVLEPWEIRPDMIEFTTGVPGHKYIEQVSFTAPRNLQTRGNDENPLRGVLI